MGYFEEYLKSKNVISEAIWDDVKTGVKSLFAKKEKPHWLDQDFHTKQTLTGRKNAAEREAEKKSAEEMIARFGDGNLRQALDSYTDNGEMLDPNVVRRIATNNQIVQQWNEKFKKFYLSSQSQEVKNMVVKRALETMGFSKLPTVPRQQPEPEQGGSIFDREPDQSGVDTKLFNKDDTMVDQPKPIDLKHVREFAARRAAEDMNLSYDELRKEVREKFPDLFARYKLAPAMIGKIVRAALRPKAVRVPKERKKKVSNKYEPQDFLSFDDFIKRRGLVR